MNEIQQLQKTLDEHLRECAATNAEVAVKLKGILWLLGVIGSAVIFDVVTRIN